MTGKLAFVATTGLIGAVIFLVLGIGLSGPDWGAGGWWIAGQSTCGPATSTRQQVTLPFSAGDSLTIDLPASVHTGRGTRRRLS